MTVNHWVAGSSPARGANEINNLPHVSFLQIFTGAMIVLGLKFII
jgi:hypothetical protein